MNDKTRFPRKALTFTAAILATFGVLVLLSGCDEEPAAQQTQQAEQTHDGHEHASHDHASADEPVVQTASLVQETCPIMEGNPINKNLFVEYEGKKVYFCCPGCSDRFLAAPEQYVAKLPQFQK